MLAWVYVPCVPANSWVMGFLTRMVLTISVRFGRDSRLAGQRWLRHELNQPFRRWDDFDNARPHAILVDLGNELLEVAELPHGLERVSSRLIGAKRCITSVIDANAQRATAPLPIATAHRSGGGH